MTDTSKHVRHFERQGLILWTLAIVVSLAACALYARLVLPTDQMAAVITSALVNLTNGDREDAALGSLTVSPKLVAAAQAKANDMARNSYFAHTSPDGRTSWSWFRDAGYSFSHAGENLAVNFSDSVDVEKAWMNSPTHRANILNGNFTEVGIATAVGEYQGKKTVFVVQMFGTPAATAETVPVREVAPAAATDIATATTEPEPNVLGTEAAEVEETPAPAAAVAPVSEPVPAIAPIESASKLTTPSPEVVVTSPKTLLRTLYLLASLLLIGILLIITGFELRRHHARHVFAVGLLLVLMGGALFVADAVLFSTPVVGQVLTP